MNCKQGDLAIVVRSTGPGTNLGKIVRCVRFVGSRRGWNDVWETNVAMTWRNVATGVAVLRHEAPDEFLRPIRGDLLDNETEQGKELAHVR